MLSATGSPSPSSPSERRPSSTISRTPYSAFVEKSISTKSYRTGRIRAGTRRRLRLDQALADRVADQLHAVAHAQLPHRVRAMVLNGLLRQMEDRGDLPVRVGLRDELDDLLLARRELVLPGGPLAEDVLDQRALSLRGQERLTALHRPHGIDQVGVRLRFEHVAGGPRLQGFEQVALVVVHRQDEHRDL